MSMTDRQTVVKHFADRKITFDKSVDLAIYLKEDQIRRKELEGQTEYVDRVLKSGYTSKMTKELLNDINSATANQPESEQESK
jgi:hypothetical protein